MGESSCQNTREMLDLYLDNELLVESNQSVLEHLSSCQECAAESERRIELRRLLKKALTLDDDDQRKHEDLSRKRVETALAHERRARTTARIRWAVLAASLIVALGLSVGYWRIRSPSNPNNSEFVNTPTSPQNVLVAAVDRDAVENHQVCALSYPPSWTFDAQRVARDLTPRFAPLVDVVGRNHASYELIEGHVCTYQENHYAHLIFRGNGHTVSVFIDRDDTGSNSKSSHPDEIDQASYKAYQVARVDTEHRHIFVVSDLPRVENLALANQLIPATLGFVHKLELGVG
ncbi:MAG TPA: zf-HC2 domain-containing protein [Pyrinomonadaceae bacterium]